MLSISRPIVRHLVSTSARSRPVLFNRAMASSSGQSKQEWLVIIPDHAGTIEKRLEVRKKHLEGTRVPVETKKLFLGGATLDEPIKEGEQMKFNGSAMIWCGDSKEEVLEDLSKDIYYTSGVWNLEAAQIFAFKSAIREAL